jgi:hypothetical protein
MPSPTLQLRADLTDYAHMVAQDEQRTLELAKELAPVVETGSSLVTFAKFDDDNAFQVYNAKRGIGGVAKRISFGASTDTVDLSANALEIGIDDGERLKAGGAQTLLEQAKTKTLVCSGYNSHLSSVITVLKAGVSAVAGKGNWSDANVDPIDEMDEQITAIARYMMPNKIIMDIGALRKLKNHPKVTKRFTAKGFTVADVLGQLINPSLKLHITSASFNSYGFDNANQDKTAALGAEVWLCYNSDSATPYDPSFAKVFATRADLFDGVNMYREDQTRSDILALDWVAQPKLISTLLVRRLVIT